MKTYTRMFWAGVLALGLAVLAPTARATPMLDQEKSPPFSNAAGNGFYRAQTFTVGISGLLTGFEVYMNGNGTSDFEIWSAPGGVPEAVPGTALASAMVSFSGTDFFGADISSFGFNVTAGDVLALVQISGSSTGSGYWYNSEPGDYAGGAGYLSFVSGPGGGWYAPVELDFGFRTYVDPGVVPEPASLVLVGSVLVGLVHVRRRWVGRQ